MNALLHRRINPWIVVMVVVGLLIVLASVPNRLRAFAQQQAGGSADQSTAELLELGKPIEKGLVGGGSHSYRMVLTAGQFLNVVVEQRGIDVVVVLFGPDGKQIIEIDSPNGEQGPEPVSVITDVAGVYRLEVRSLEKDAKAGRYESKIVELRAATEEDRNLIVKERDLRQANQLNSEANNLRRAGQYDKALPLAERALAIREKVLGLEHPDVAISLNNLANLYSDKGDYAKAELLYQRGLVIREKVLGLEHPDVATSLNNLANLYSDKGDFAKAELLHQRALVIREKALGPEHPDVATSLNNLAFLHSVQSSYIKAEPLYQRALAIREKVLGPEHPDVAISLNNLAGFYNEKGDYIKVEPLYRRALAIWEKALGPTHPNVATTLNNLALFSYDKGDYVKAELLHQRAFAIREKALGPEHPDVAVSLNNLAGLYDEKGDYIKAEPMHQRALAIREKTFGPEHPDVAISLNNLALHYREKGDYAKVEQLHQRALTIWEKALGPEHPAVATSLNTLALFLYSAKGDYDKAEPLYQRALAIRERSLGFEHPAVATSLNNLALLYYAKGDYDKAEPLYQRALAIRERSLGFEHPAVATSLNNLAHLYYAKGDYNNAVALAVRAGEVAEHNVLLNIAIGSERQKLAYLATMSGELDFYASLHSQFAAQNPMARSIALNALLRRKGRVLDAMNDSLVALRRRANSHDKVLFGQLRETSVQLARLVFNGPQKTTPVEHQQKIKELEEQKEKIEAEISRNSSEFRALSQPITLENVQAAIPPSVALVEFALYRSVNPKATKQDERFGQRRYAGYILRQQGEVQWADLGEANSIDDAVTALRQAIRDPKSTKVKQLARAVDEKVMRPVRKLLGETRQVLLSPDGMLNLLPFAALVDEQNRYLVERYSFTYLSSGRDLLRLQAARPNDNPALVVANPKFGLIGAAAATAASATETKGGETAAEPAGRNFGELVWTGLEAASLKQLLPPQTQVLTGEQATETALKQAHAPRLLHIATHGFFLEDAAPPQPESRGFELTSFADLRSVSWAAKIENPLLRSGLVLAGANERRSGNDDGILTALEAAGLDLWGTKLVVLSACDTGVGEVKNGEGVYGLRRALVLAGAESQVMSLWPVSDKATSGLMTGYYERLLKRKEGRGEALRQAQLDILRDPKRKAQQKHPYYWAGFIQAGEWANLDGKR